MTAHTHAFTHWPFPVPVSTLGFCTDKVAYQGFPVLLVTHDTNGDWQFLDDSGDELGEPVLLCLGCVLEKDASLAEIADLPAGWSAWRPQPGAPWQRWEREDEDEDDEESDEPHDCGDMEQRERKALSDIDQYGLHVLNIRAEDKKPPFSYSIGIGRSLGLPELIIVGMSAEVAHAVINDCYARMKAGERLEPGMRIGDLLEGDYDCLVGAVSPSYYAHYMGWARWLYDGDDFQALQIIYPNTAGVYPFDKEASDGFRQWQPLLAPAPH